MKIRIPVCVDEITAVCSECVRRQAFRARKIRLEKDLSLLVSRYRQQMFERRSELFIFVLGADGIFLVGADWGRGLFPFYC
jgi:hypothetical protein